MCPQPAENKQFYQGSQMQKLFFPFPPKKNSHIFLVREKKGKKRERGKRKRVKKGRGEG